MPLLRKEDQKRKHFCLRQWEFSLFVSEHGWHHGAYLYKSELKFSLPPSSSLFLSFPLSSSIFLSLPLSTSLIHSHHFPPSLFISFPLHPLSLPLVFSHPLSSSLILSLPLFSFIFNSLPPTLPSSLPSNHNSLLFSSQSLRLDLTLCA